MLPALRQAKVYLSPGQAAPKGVSVKTGKDGGRYYESTGASPKAQQPSKGGAGPKKQNGPPKKASVALVSPEDMNWLKGLGVKKFPPPNASGVTIHKNSDPERQALMTYRDAAGRIQHAYSQKFHENNAAVKWKSVEKFRPKVQKMREVLNGIVKKETIGTPAYQEALVASIIAHTGLRPGSPLSAASGHFGVSTLQTNHVKFQDGAAHLEFVGKSGALNRKVIVDPVLVGGLKQLSDSAKVAGHKNLFTVDVSNVRSILPKGMKLKTFRTIIATEEAERFLASKKVKLTGDKKADTKAVAATLKEASTWVSTQLNNTPAVARSSYIHPAVFSNWLQAIGGAHLAV